jgi:hypothetical protein
MSTFDDMIRIAEIHASRINMAMVGLAKLFPLEESKVIHLSDQDIMYIELLISRFSKLQDYLGRQVINAFLKMVGDYEDNLTMLDKIHKLERLNIIEKAEIWEEMREARNHIAHEYPDKPALTAIYLNKIFLLAPQLLKLLDNIKEKKYYYEHISKFY